MCSTSLKIPDDILEQEPSLDEFIALRSHKTDFEKFNFMIFDMKKVDVKVKIHP